MIESIGQKSSDETTKVYHPHHHSAPARNPTVSQVSAVAVGASLSHFLSQDHCLLCKTKVNFASEIEKKFHCVDHFFDSLCSIFQDFITPTDNATLFCVHSNCRMSFLKQNNDDKGFLRRFFIHIGFAHDYMEKLFFPRKLNKFPISMCNLAEGSVESLLLDRFWAIRAGSCLVCPATNLGTRSERIQHYVAHFVQLGNIFGPVWEARKLCFICGCSTVSKESYRWHLYEVHFQKDIKANMKYKRNGLFQCLYCKEENSNPDRLVKHLISSELLLDVFCLKYVRQHKMKVSKIYDFDQESKKIDAVRHAEIASDSDDDLCTELTTIGNTGEDGQKRESEESNTTIQYENKIAQFLDKAKVNQKPFIQNAPCYMLDKNLSPCHECKKIQLQSNYAELSGTCCCFEGFRKLRYSDDGQLLLAGYLDPKEAKPSDMEIWTPNLSFLHKDLSNDGAFFLVRKIGDLLCNIILEEKNLRSSFLSSGKQIVWKRQHQGVREMCDVCSTSIFDLHFTCSSCGLLVCSDCYLARRLGTKYKSLGMMNKPYRTRKRFRANLDVNLWPMCMEDRIHDLDRLILTQMSPAMVTEDVVDDIHKIKKFYKLPSDCNCCQNSEKNLTAPAIEKSFSINIFDDCTFCGTSLKHVSLICKRIHLASHLREKIIDTKLDTCEKCDLQLGSNWLLLIHGALVHNAVDKHLETIFIETEAKDQLESILTIDNHESCIICSHKFDGVKEKNRQHYLHHLSENLFDTVSASAPFKCQVSGCLKTECNRYRLMVHNAIVHKQIETALRDFLNGKSEKTTDSYSSWSEIPFCVVCNEKHLKTTGYVKRAHYFKHFRGLVEKHINTRFNQLLKKGPLYQCPLSGCDQTFEIKHSFLMHMAFKHRMIDQFIEVAAKSLVEKQSSSSTVDVSFMKRCELCDQDLSKLDLRENLKNVRTHYSIHFKDKIAEAFPTAFSRDQSYLSCPYDSCGFSTVSLNSDQYGHHKRKLVGHLGIDHELFKNFLKGETIISRNNGPSTEYLYHDACKICGETNDARPQMRRNHLFKHFRFVLAEQFQELSTGSRLVKCPYCKFSNEGLANYDAVRAVAVHLGHEHGLFDKLIQDFTKKIDYELLERCQVCPQRFDNLPDKVATVKKHYYNHFAKDIEGELGGVSKEKCSFCKSQFLSLEELIIHVGDRHGFFCRIIEKIQLEQESELDDSIDDDEDESHEEEKSFSVFHDEASFQCLICGQFICTAVTKNIEEFVVTAKRDHLYEHLSNLVTPNMSGVKRESESTVLSVVFNVENLEQLFIPVLRDYEHNVLEDLPEKEEAEEVDKKEPEKSEPDEKDSEKKKPCKGELHKQPDESTIDVTGASSKEIMDRLSSCCFCKESCSFTGVNIFTVKLHLLRHLAHDLVLRLPLHPPFKCPECMREFKNRFSLIVHFGVCHNEIGGLIKIHLTENHIQILEEKAERSTGSEMTRYTLPDFTKRFQCICLLCGSSVILASTYRLASETDVSKDLLLKEGMSLHLMTKHFAEYFPESMEELGDCQTCGKSFTDKSKLKCHVVNCHPHVITDVIRQICGSQIHSEPEQLQIKDLFVSLNCQGFVDTVVFDPKVLEEGGTELPEETENDQVQTGKIITFQNLILYHKAKNLWICDFCMESFGPENQKLGQYLWKNHVLSHFESECKKNLSTPHICDCCSLEFQSSLSLLSHLAFVHKQLDVWLNDNLSCSPEKLESIQKEIEAEEYNAKELKRKNSMNDEKATKKARADDDFSVIPIMKANNCGDLRETFECDICQTSFAASSEDTHIFDHQKEDLRKVLEVENMACHICQTHFKSMKEFLEHMGILHGYALSCYKKLTASEISNKRALFMDSLSQTVPISCQICNDSSYLAGNGKARVMEYLNHLSSCHSSCLESICLATKCTSCKIVISSPQKLLLHSYLEHRSLITAAILTTVSEDWKTIGGINCELCTDSFVFSVPSSKRIHLAKNHFVEEISSSIIQKQASFQCPLCPYLSYSLEDTVAHVSKTHRVVDNLLSAALQSNHQPGKSGQFLGTISVCPVCIEPCCTAQKESHILDHFFSKYIAPNLTAVRCPFPGCVLSKAALKKNGFIYGRMANHIGAEHFGDICLEFLDSSVKKWLGSPEELLSVQHKINSLLLSKTCILCEQEFCGCPQSHMQGHFQPTVDSLIKDEIPYQCELCDGFPDFLTVRQLRLHHMEDHLDIDSILKTLVSTEQLKKQRTLLGIQLGNTNVGSQRRPDGVPRRGKRRQREPSPESLTSSPTSSRCSSPANSLSWASSACYTTAGHRPPVGIKKWKAGRLQCEFEGCHGGYKEGAYYTHLAQDHFKELLIRDLGKERSLQGSLERDPLLCPRCIYQGADLDQLLEHYGEYHQVLDYYVEVAWSPHLANQKAQPMDWKKLEADKCSFCGFR